MPLPNPGMVFTPFDPLPASDLNDLVENIEALQDWSAYDAGTLPATLIDSDAIDHGFVEIGRATLGVAGDTLTVSSLPARKYLKILIYLYSTGGTVDAQIRFNADSGSNYALAIVYNNGSTPTALEQTAQTAAGLEVGTVVSGGTEFIDMSVTNVSNRNKMIIYNTVTDITATAASSAPRVNMFGAKWVNTAAQISSISVINTGTGDMAIGSEIVVMGHD